MGTAFGKYELHSQLAKGGMGETYLAELHATAGVTKRLVIKKMLKALLEDEALRDAFVQEARISATLSHGNIAQVFDFGEVDGEYFLAMEYVHGRSLQAVLDRAKAMGWQRLPLPVSVYVAIELLKALHYAHTRVGPDGVALNLVHRDVSPDNVLLSFEGEVKLVDFGVAKSSMKGRTETEPGLVKGKYRYLSPEQARAETLDARSDVFSAGVVLYELFTSRAPFSGSGHLVMRNIVNETPTPPRVHVPELPEALAGAVMKALEKNRDNRFASALSMQEALARWLYRQAPDFSAEVLRELMGTLFSEELAEAGTPFTPKEAATRIFRALAPPVATTREEPAVTRKMMRPPRQLPMPVLVLAALAGAVVALLGGSVMIARTLFDEPAPVVSAAVQLQPISIGDQRQHVDAQLKLAREKIDALQWADALKILEGCFVGDSLDPEAVKLIIELKSEEPLRAAIDKADQLIDRDQLGMAKEELESAEHTRFLQRRWSEVNEKLARATQKVLEEGVQRSSPSRVEAEKLIEQARTFYREKTPFGYQEAKTRLEKCVTVDPTYAECHMLLGACLGQLGNARGGAKEYEKFLQLAPDHAKAPQVRQLLESYRANNAR